MQDIIESQIAHSMRLLYTEAINIQMLEFIISARNDHTYCLTVDTLLWKTSGLADKKRMDPLLLIL